MRWLWDFHCTIPSPPPPAQNHGILSRRDSLKTFEYIGHLETR